MPPTHRRLPPFAGLVAFDAVLRHGSVTRAAAELGLTQSAVSHRLRTLEEHFGAPLLLRLNPGLRATEVGARLGRELGPLLGALAGLRGRVALRPRARPFRLGVGVALLAWWLSPRLSALAEAFPDLAVEVVSWPVGVEAAPAEADLALNWLPPPALAGGPGELAFAREAVFPVAAPRLLAGRSPADWQGLPLLAKGREGEDAGPEWSWVAWLGGEAPVTAMRFRDIGGALGAAADGHGVALARTLLVADALRQRRLVRLVPRAGVKPCSKVQVARWRDPGDASAARMAAWLVATAGKGDFAAGRWRAGRAATPCAADAV